VILRKERGHTSPVRFRGVSDGEDLRKLPLHLRKNNLARLLARRVNGIFLANFEQGEIGPDLFRHACLMGLEGLVSKHKDRPYRAGRSPHWVKVKNREHAAMSRVGAITVAVSRIACSGDRHRPG
jgi:bifunctional non-homologous end joining protein LigD